MLNELKDKAEDAAEKIADKAEEIGEKAADAAEEQIGKVFFPILEESVESCFEPMGKMSSEAVVKNMTEKYEKLLAVEGIADQAKSATDKAIMTMHEEVMEYCKDCAEQPWDGFSKVGTILLRTMYKAVSDAVDAMMAKRPKGFCSCCAEKYDNKQLIEDTYQSLVDPFKDVLKGKIKEKGDAAPDKMVDKVMEKIEPKMSFTKDDDIGVPKSREGKEAAAPEQQKIETE